MWVVGNSVSFVSGLPLPEGAEIHYSMGLYLWQAVHPSGTARGGGSASSQKEAANQINELRRIWELRIFDLTPFDEQPGRSEGSKKGETAQRDAAAADLAMVQEMLGEAIRERDAARMARDLALARLGEVVDERNQLRRGTGSS